MARTPITRPGTVLSKVLAFLAFSAGMYSLGAANGLAVGEGDELHPYLRAKIERLQRRLPRDYSLVSSSDCLLEAATLAIAEVDLADAQSLYEQAEEDYMACSEDAGEDFEGSLEPIPLIRD